MSQTAEPASFGQKLLHATTPELGTDGTVLVLYGEKSARGDRLVPEVDELNRLAGRKWIVLKQIRQNTDITINGTTVSVLFCTNLRPQVMQEAVRQARLKKKHFVNKPFQMGELFAHLRTIAPKATEPAAAEEDGPASAGGQPRHHTEPEPTPVKTVAVEPEELPDEAEAALAIDPSDPLAVIGDFVNRCEAVQYAVMQVQEEAAGKDARILQLERELGDAKAELQTANGASEVQRRQLADILAEKGRLAAEVHDLKPKADRVPALEKDLATVRQALEARQQEVTGLRDSLGKKDGELEGLRSRIAELEKDSALVAQMKKMLGKE